MSRFIGAVRRHRYTGPVYDVINEGRPDAFIVVYDGSGCATGSPRCDDCNTPLVPKEPGAHLICPNIECLEG